MAKEETNASPETEPDVEEVDLDQIIEEKLADDGFVSKLKDRLGMKAEPSGGEKTPVKSPEGEGGDGATRGESAPTGGSGESSSPAPPVAATPQPVQDVKQTVRDVLAEEGHRKEHETLAAPPEPKPPRKGIAAMLFGAKR